jgi:hypothetical protein
VGLRVVGCRKQEFVRFELKGVSTNLLSAASHAQCIGLRSVVQVYSIYSICDVVFTCGEPAAPVNSAYLMHAKCTSGRTLFIQVRLPLTRQTREPTCCFERQGNQQSDQVSGRETPAPWTPRPFPPQAVDDEDVAGQGNVTWSGGNAGKSCTFY